jgi:D-serine deaminase-like pyridoxal phosphate-dependent protein
VVLDAVMGYEGHIAGPNDAVPGRAFKNAAIRFLKSRSISDFTPRRDRLVRDLRERGFSLPVVNGGGSGSIVSTLRDPAVTEITAGSAFYAPGLFWHYKEVSYIPAAFFALQAVRFPAPGLVTCQGGGYPASGPAGADKLPVPVYPEGMKYLPLEGAGEVQTPLALPKSSPAVGLGDPLFFQHAKAGELAERFNEFYCISKDPEGNYGITGRAKTYRGEGKAFI